MTELEDDDVHIEESQDDIIWTVSRASGGLLVEVSLLLGNQVL